MEKLNFENFNDVIRAYRKYFRKSYLQTKCVEFDSVLPATNCSLISLKVLGHGLFAFKGIYDVIFINRKLHKNGKRYVVFDDTLLKASVFLFLITLVSSKSDKKIVILRRLEKILMLKAAESVSFRNYCMWIFRSHKKLDMTKLSIKVELISYDKPFYEFWLLAFVRNTTLSVAFLQFIQLRDRGNSNRNEYLTSIYALLVVKR